MFAIDQPYTIALLASAIISFSMAVAILLHRHAHGGGYAFAALKACVGLWAFASLFEVCSQHVPSKIFAYSFKYLFIVMVPVTWFFFGLYYSNRLKRPKGSQIIWFMILPAVTILLTATNGYHNWMFTSLEVIETSTNTFIMRDFGPWFWVHAVYSYVLLLLGFFFIGKHLLDSPSHYRWQVLTLLVGGLAPWATNIVFTLNLMPIPYLDLTPFAFTISGLAFMVGIFRFQLLDVVPIAQDVVMENIEEGIVVVDNESRVLNLNPAARDLIDTQLTTVIGSKAENIFSWWNRIGFNHEASGMTEPVILELTVNNQRRLIRPKRQSLYCNDREAGQLVTLHNVTDAMMAKEALRSSEERFRSLSENAPVIIFAVDPAGIIGYLNPAFESILGHDRQLFIGCPFVDLILEQDRASCNKTFDLLLQGKKNVAELNLTLHHENGITRLFNTSIAANFDSLGTVTGIIGLAKDITEEHELQCQLFQSQKMEAIGTLAGGIAHDFNNLLMGMQANLSLMNLDRAEELTLYNRVRRVEEQIQSGANLTKQLLGYARKGKYTMRTVDINHLVKESLLIVKRTNKGIIIQNLPSDDPIHIMADSGQIEMVLLNLFVNAIDAMPNGGRLTVSTRLVPNTDGKILEQDDTIQYCELLVADSGIGMDEATQKHIFEPFFTTKEKGRGTGLGLASVYGVIKNHGGYIEVSSKEGEGTTFSLFIPTTKEAVQQTPSAGICELPVKEGKILIVEDEPLIRKFSAEMVQSLKFPVLEAQNGEDAVDIYKEHHKDIILVILDMIMPGMDGYSVYKAFMKINPQVKVIISSGYAADKRIDEILSEGNHACLKKPYTLEDLADKIMDLLSVEQPDPKEISIAAP